ncbi:MAG: hypothetical protein WC511_01605 [Candidatus Pacearchaeota archaeon]
MKIELRMLLDFPQNSLVKSTNIRFFLRHEFKTIINLIQTTDEKAELYITGQEILNAAKKSFRKIRGKKLIELKKFTRDWQRITTYLVGIIEDPVNPEKEDVFIFSTFQNILEITSLTRLLLKGVTYVD